MNLHICKNYSNFADANIIHEIYLTTHKLIQLWQKIKKLLQQRN